MATASRKSGGNDAGATKSVGEPEPGNDDGGHLRDALVGHGGGVQRQRGSRLSGALVVAHARRGDWRAVATGALDTVKIQTSLFFN